MCVGLTADKVKAIVHVVWEAGLEFDDSDDEGEILKVIRVDDKYACTYCPIEQREVKWAKEHTLDRVKDLRYRHSVEDEGSDNYSSDCDDKPVRKRSKVTDKLA